jgi:hypothetical protein
MEDKIVIREVIRDVFDEYEGVPKQESVYSGSSFSFVL